MSSFWEAGGSIPGNRECLWEKTQIEESNNKATCNYLQSEQCHSIDLLNLLITSRKTFSLFLWYYLWNASHSAVLKSRFLMWCKTSVKYLYCGNVIMHSQLCNFCNQPHLFLANKSEWLFVVASCLTEKG